MQSGTARPRLHTGVGATLRSPSFSPRDLGGGEEMRTKLLVWLAAGSMTPAAATGQDWSQGMRNAQHTGAVSAAGQPAAHVLADVVYDPFVDQEKADPLAAPDLLVHYQAPLVDGNDVYMEFKSGTFTKVKT